MWILSVFLTLWINMAAIAYAFTEVNTVQTTTSTTAVDVPGAVITSGNFIVAKKYLIYITAQLSNSTASSTCVVDTYHGTTVFANSRSRYSHAPGTAEERGAYSFMSVWTAVTGEGIKLQFFASANTASINFVSMFVMKLSDDLVENTDWFFAERTTADGLSTTFLNGASITFTPGTAGQDWLVCSHAALDAGGVTTISAISRLNRSGEATSALPSVQFEHATGAIWPATIPRVFNLGSASNTFIESAAESSSTFMQRLYSAIFAIKLANFASASATYGAGPTSLSATAYATQLQSITVTPTVQGEVWMGAHWGFDRQNAGREAQFRLQVDNADQPGGQTTAAYNFDPGTDATDEGPMNISSLVTNMTAAAHTVELEASADATAGTPEGQDWTVWAIPMQLTRPDSILSNILFHPGVSPGKMSGRFIQTLQGIIVPTPPPTVTVVFRKTLSGIGTAVGKRQTHDS